MKPSFTLSPSLVAKLSAINATYKVRTCQPRGHKVVISFEANNFTPHQVLSMVREAYPEARQVSITQDGDYHDVATIHLNDT